MACSILTRHAGFFRWASVCAKSVVFGFSKWKSQKERKKSSKWMYITICLTETKLNGLPGNFTINWKAKFVSYQTFKRPRMHLLFWSTFIWRFFFGEEKFSWLHPKNEVADENLHSPNKCSQTQVKSSWKKRIKSLSLLWCHFSNKLIHNLMGRVSICLSIFLSK